MLCQVRRLSAEPRLVAGAAAAPAAAEKKYGSKAPSAAHYLGRPAQPPPLVGTRRLKAERANNPLRKLKSINRALVALERPRPPSPVLVHCEGSEEPPPQLPREEIEAEVFGGLKRVSNASLLCRARAGGGRR